MRLYVMVAAVAAAVLYGSTYQQFRFFSLDDPGGAFDAVRYVDVANGHVQDYPEIRHYRSLTPAAAHLVQPFARLIVRDDELSIRLAFYMVNFFFSLVACLALFRLLRILHFSALLSLIGVCAFASSRVTSLVTGTPMVDAGYFCAIAIIGWLTLEKQVLALACLMPLLALSKETVIPFLLLPFVTGLRKRPSLWIGLAASAAAVAVKSELLAGYYSGGNATYLSIVTTHMRESWGNTLHLFTLAGFHDFQNGFSLLLPLSVIGARLNTMHRYHRIPLVLIATVPMAFVLAIISGNAGRMFFAAFPAVIAYALITVEHVTSGGAARPLPAHDA